MPTVTFRLNCNISSLAKHIFFAVAFLQISTFSANAETNDEFTKKLNELSHEVDTLSSDIKYRCPQEKDKGKLVISPGDSAPGEIRAELAVRTDGTPETTQILVRGPIITPNGTKLNLAAATVEAQVQGGAQDSRLLFRLKKLSFQKSENVSFTVGVDGWIVADDGIRGIPAELEKQETGIHLRNNAPQKITLVFSTCTVLY